jgi:hypothetical protein
LAVLILLQVLLNFRIAYSPPPPLGDIKGLSVRDPCIGVSYVNYFVDTIWIIHKYVVIFCILETFHNIKDEYFLNIYYVVIQSLRANAIFSYWLIY